MQSDDNENVQKEKYQHDSDNSCSESKKPNKKLKKSKPSKKKLKYHAEILQAKNCLNALHTDETKALEKQQIKEQQHRRFVRMIIEHESTPKQIKTLQRTKTKTEMEINIRYMKVQANRKYQFPRKKRASQKAINKGNKYSLDTQGETTKSQKKSTTQICSFSSDDDCDYSLEELKGKGIYDLRQQNIGLFDSSEQEQQQKFVNVKINKNDTTTKQFNQFIMHLYQEDRERFQRLIKTPAIISTCCKTLSLNPEKQKDQLKKTRVKTLEKADQGSLEKLRIERLLNKRKNILASNNSHWKALEKITEDKSLDNKKNCRTGNIKSQQNLFVGKQNTKEKLKTQQSYLPASKRFTVKTQSIQNQSNFIRNVKASEVKSSKNLELHQKQLASLSDTKQLKFPLVQQTSKRQILDKIHLKNNTPKKVKNIFALRQSSHKCKSKSRKDLQNAQLKECVKNIIGKKLKTQTNTPECLSPRRYNFRKDSHDETHFSKLLQSQKIKNIGNTALKQPSCFISNARYKANFM